MMISAKSAKKLTCVTCAASLLVSDLIAASQAQTTEPESNPGPTTPNPRSNDRHPERSTDTNSSPVAQPEPVGTVESISRPPATEAAAPMRVLAIAPPETLPTDTRSQSRQATSSRLEPGTTKGTESQTITQPVLVQAQTISTDLAKTSQQQQLVTPSNSSQVLANSQNQNLVINSEKTLAFQPDTASSKTTKTQSSIQSNTVLAQVNSKAAQPPSKPQATISQKATDLGNQPIALPATQTRTTNPDTTPATTNQRLLETNQTQVVIQSNPPLTVTPEKVTIGRDRPVAITNPATPQGSAIAQTPAPVTTPTPPTILPRAAGKFSSNDWLGNPGPFFGVGGFVPLRQQPGKDITFAEGQMIVPTNGGIGGNVVLGHRVYDQKSDRIYGGYIGFDHRNTGNTSFNQVGLGAEALGKNWDIRANAYLPVGDTRKLVSENVTNSVSALSNPFFTSNFLAVNRTLQQQISRHYEAAATSIDLEAGGKVANLGKNGELRGYGGLYYLKAPGNDGAVGFRTRLEARPSDLVNVGLGLSTDRVFGTSVAFTVGVNLPTSRPRKSDLKEPFLERLGDSVVRNSNIMVDEQKESIATVTQDTQFLTNPATGQPWRFRHSVVGVGTGNGTFENPTGTVAEALAVAQPNDIVYVQPGTNPGIPTFTIPDGVQVWSTGPNQFINTVELGNLQLPLSGAGVLPTVTGTVTMGNNTGLSGFAIATTTGPGILANNVGQFVIRDNAIANTAGAGIQLNNVQGQVQIFDNSIQQAQNNGIALDNAGGQVDLLLTRNQITNNGGSSVDGDGVNLTLRNGATGNFTVTNNAIANNSSSGGLANGIEVQQFDSSSGNFTVADNTITGNQLNGISISQESTAQGTFNVARNNLSSNGLNGFEALLSDSAQGTFNLDSNTINSNQLKGVQVIAAETSRANLSLTNSTVTGNQDDGVLLQSSDQAQLNATILNTTIANNARYGIFTNATGTSQFRILAGSNIITGNGLPGVSLNTSNSASTAAALRSNTITGNGFSDVDVFNLTPGATVCLQPLNNTIGNLTLDDFFGGPIAVEAGALGTNSVTTADTTFWSGTTVPAGSCGF